MPPASSPGNVQPTSWLKNFENPGQATQLRAQRPVESEVHATTASEAVLPLREERIVAGGDEHRLGRGLDRRAVVAEQLREARR